MSETQITARRALADLLEAKDLTESAAAELMHALTDPELPPALAGAVLVALRMKGEIAAEIRGFATAMRELARDPGIPAGAPTVDCVGTGGDGSGSVNISTGAALLAAASGVRVVKHGNRAVSSKSGSADVLEALGLPLPLDEKAAVRCLEETSFTFLFAPFYHPAMKSIAPVRAAMGVRTVFNLLGPLSNPARPPFGVIGAFSPSVARLMADTLSGMDIERVFVVHGEPGWDEATPVGPFLLYDVRPGQVEEQHRDPADYKYRALHARGSDRRQCDRKRGESESRTAWRARSALRCADARRRADARSQRCGQRPACVAGACAREHQLRSRRDDARATRSVRTKPVSGFSVSDAARASRIRCP